MGYVACVKKMINVLAYNVFAKQSEKDTFERSGYK
jgi:hypothetical protein